MRNCTESATTFTVTGTINLSGVLPDIASDITISGPGSGQLTVQRNTADFYRIFNIASGTVGLSGMTVSNGSTDTKGGGIQNLSNLTMNDVVVGSNQAGGSAGGVNNQGTLVISNSSVTGNSTANAVGALFNSAGGIANTGTLTMTNCVVSGNRTADGNTSGNGGGIHNSGAMTLITTTISNNLTGNASNNSGSGGGIFTASSNASLLNCTVSGNTTGTSSAGNRGSGGGIDSLVNTTIVGSTISGNTGRLAGGILVEGTLVATNSTISANLPVVGISIANNSAAMHLANCTITGHPGSGIENSISSVPSTVRNSIIAGNGADTSGNFTSRGHNLIGFVGSGSGFTNGVNGDQVGTSGSP
jgi:hypothetical protein